MTEVWTADQNDPNKPFSQMFSVNATGQQIRSHYQVTTPEMKFINSNSREFLTHLYRKIGALFLLLLGGLHRVWKALCKAKGHSDQTETKLAQTSAPIFVAAQLRSGGLAEKDPSQSSSCSKPEVGEGRKWMCLHTASASLHSIDLA